MNIPIITTKLHIPKQPEYMVPRARLSSKFEDGKRGKLILVSATAGFGKTASIADWVSHCKGK